MSANKKAYLGDGAYVALDHDRAAIVLTTEDGVRVTNEIVLGDVELAAFFEWLAGVGVNPEVIKLMLRK